MQQGQNTVSIEPILNDPQHLQLCAIHTINNLLQITNNNDATIETQTEDGDDTTTLEEQKRHRLKSDKETTRMILVHGQLYTQSKIDFASKEELNTIADEMSKREIALMNNTEESENSEMNQGISLWTKLRSNHRTLFTGNYSHEVLEAALSKRNISLNWFNIGANEINPLHLSKYYSAGKDDDSSSQQIVIGYVVNTDQIKPYSLKKLVHRAIPSIYSGRHWSVVTKVRVVNDLSPNDYGTESAFDATSSRFIHSTTGEVIDYNAKHWYMIDSKSCNTTTLINDVELLEVLKAVKENNGNVFQAVDQTLQNAFV